VSDEDLDKLFMPESERRILELIERLADHVATNAAETQKRMDFLINQQAESAVKINRLAEKVEALAVVQHRAEEKWARTEGGIRQLLTIAEIHEGEITALGELARGTDDRLNSLITVVERYISEGRNGRS
jgi:hypothetical protein